MRGGILADAVAQHRHGFDPPRPPQRAEPCRQRVKRRLRVVGAGEQGAVVEDLRQRPIQAYHRVAAFDDRAEHRREIHQPGSHAGVGRALPGAEEGDARTASGGDRRGRERGTCGRGISGNHREAMRQAGAAGGAAGQRGKVGSRVRQELRASARAVARARRDRGPTAPADALAVDRSRSLAGARSSTMWALVPEKPNELTPTQPSSAAVDARRYLDRHAAEVDMRVERLEVQAGGYRSDDAASAPP